MPASNKNWEIDLNRKNSPSFEVNIVDQNYPMFTIMIEVRDKNILKVGVDLLYPFGQSRVVSLLVPYKLKEGESYNESTIQLNLTSSIYDKTQIKVDALDHDHGERLMNIFASLDWQTIKEFYASDRKEPLFKPASRGVILDLCD